MYEDIPRRLKKNQENHFRDVLRFNTDLLAVVGFSKVRKISEKQKCSEKSKRSVLDFHLNISVASQRKRPVDICPRKFNF